MPATSVSSSFSTSMACVALNELGLEQTPYSSSESSALTRTFLTGEGLVFLAIDLPSSSSSSSSSTSFLARFFAGVAVPFLPLVGLG